MGYSQSVRNDFIRLRLQGETIESIQTDHYPRISLKTLKSWEIRTNTTGNLVAKKSPGRPQKIQGRDERRLVRVAKRIKGMSIKRIAQEADINACHETLVKVLKRNNLQSLPMLKNPKLRKTIYVSDTTGHTLCGIKHSQTEKLGHSPTNAVSHSIVAKGFGELL
jgi:transposase